MFFFFFKQKTAYEMRISDWSSDVCSSDLWLAVHDIAEEGGEAGRLLLVCEACADLGGQIRKAAFPLLNLEPGAQLPGDCLGIGGGGTRSEEHTSELQSLMRISYAVFCLKKTNKTPNPI